MTEVSTPIQHDSKEVFLKDYKVPAYFTDEVDLHFDLGETAVLVTSSLKIRRNPASDAVHKDLILNGENLLLESISLNGIPLTSDDYILESDKLILRHVPDHFSLEIKTKIKPQENTTLSGLYKTGKNFCTQCEAEGFRHITYFMDRPDILSQYTTTIVADESKYPLLLSNGNLIASGKGKDGKHWVKWEDPFKKSSYLFALVAGDYDLIEDYFTTASGRKITLRLFVDRGYADQSAHAIASLKEAMRWDEKNYGREYDLDVYMIVATNDFNMGAMENKGLNIFNAKYILAKPETATDQEFIYIAAVIGHEYFHNWTGNRVTCRDWFQLSLKEGLTIFRDQSFSADEFSKAVIRIRDVTMLREVQFSEDAGPLAHAVRPDAYIQINNFYTTTIYEKGAEVLRMMQTILGEKLFRAGMDLYFKKYDGCAVTIEDFVKTMEEVSSIDLSQFRLWYSQAGTPILSVDEIYDAKEQVYTLIFKQFCPPTPGQPEKKSMHIPIRMGLLNEKGEALPLVIVNEATENRTDLYEAVLQLKQDSQRFEFKNIASRPIPSLLRYFSAPVKLNFDYSDQDLQFLFKYDKDNFNRWDAGQKYIERVLLRLILEYQQEKPLSLPADFFELFEFILKTKMEDNLLKAEMLSLPSEKYIGEQMAVIDVDAIHYVREFVMGEIAKKLRALLLEMYHQNYDENAKYQFNTEEIGKRQLKNTCLSYLMRLPDPAIHEDIGWRQFETALLSNMTDTLPALSELANLDSPLREKALDAFYQAWKHDTLVIDKWLTVQALSRLPHTLSQVKKLLRHESFDIKNPNKVYSLIGAFCDRNASQFHAKDGEGYAFLKEYVLILDRLNPQVAARMVKPLTTWKRYDKHRQKLMRDQLELILSNRKLSSDTYELVSKSLEEPL